MCEKFSSKSEFGFELFSFLSLSPRISEWAIKKGYQRLLGWVAVFSS